MPRLTDPEIETLAAGVVDWILARAATGFDQVALHARINQAVRDGLALQVNPPRGGQNAPPESVD